MASNYTRIAGKASAEAFDGTTATADTLVAAYPDEISIYQAVVAYPTPTGSATLNPAATGVTVTITETKEEITDPMVVAIKVTAGATAAGNLTIDFFGEEIVVAVLVADDTVGEVATKIGAATYTGYTAAVVDDTVTITQDEVTTNGILAVVDENGQILNAYKDDYIVWETVINDFVESETTTVWGKTAFTKWFTAVA